MPDARATRVGRVVKPYGLEGELIVRLRPGAGRYIEPGDPVFIEMDGQRVPFFVESFEETDRDRAILGLEFIRSIEDARRISGCEIHLEEAPPDPDRDANFDPRMLVGYRAVDTELGMLGKVTGVVDHEANPVLLVDFKGRELMVPASPGIITRIREKEQLIVMELPEGLAEL